jgi:hypothetical protein
MCSDVSVLYVFPALWTKNPVPKVGENCASQACIKDRRERWRSRRMYLPVLYSTTPLLNLHISDRVGVSANYNAHLRVDPFKCIGNFLNRLRIYIEIPFSRR